MAESIEGGATMNAQGIWVDANGKPLDKGQIATAKELATQRAEERAAAELANMELAASRDPVARSLAAALRPPALAHESHGKEPK